MRGPLEEARLPDHWRIAKLTLVAKLGTGHTPDRSEPMYWNGDRLIPWLTTSDIEMFRDGRLTAITETKESIGELGLEHSSAVLHPRGTVALSRTASVGFPVIMGRDMATSQDFFTWTCSEGLEPRFLLMCLRAMRGDLVGRLAMGSTHKTIYMADIEGLRIPLPPVDEQRRIADFLDHEVARIDELIRLKRELSSQLPDRVAAVTHEVVAGLPRNARLAYVVSWYSGGTPPKGEGEHWCRDLPWASTKDLAQDELHDTMDHITEGAADAHSCVVPPGSLLIATRGMALAKRLPLAIAMRRTAFNQDLKALVPGPGLEPAYLRVVLRGLEPEILANVVEAAHGTRRLETRWLKALRVPLPEPKVQREIVGRVHVVEDQNRALADRLDRQIALLAERRETLITAAVTGQLDPASYRASAAAA